MAVFKKIVLALVLVVAALAVVGLLLPRKAHVERSLVIDAPRATIFTQLNGFRTFNKWSPWFEKDPNMKIAYEGPETGVGAKQSWSGDPKTVGSGTQEIIESRPYDTVVTALDFGAQGKATATVALAPEGDATKVTWSLDCDMGMSPVGRYVGLMMDKMVGPDYEKGLANLKRFTESLPKSDFADLNTEIVEVQPVTVAFVASRSSQEEKAIAAAIGAAYAQVGKFMATERLKQTGPPRTINTKWAEGEYVFDAAIPVDKTPARPVAATSPVKVKESYSGRAIKVVYKGPYDAMHPTYEKLYAYVAANSLEPAGPSWDEYVSDPGSTPAAELITHIYMPIH